MKTAKRRRQGLWVTRCLTEIRFIRKYPICIQFFLPPFSWWGIVQRVVRNVQVQKIFNLARLRCALDYTLRQEEQTLAHLYRWRYFSTSEPLVSTCNRR